MFAWTRRASWPLELAIETRCRAEHVLQMGIRRDISRLQVGRAAGAGAGGAAAEAAADAEALSDLSDQVALRRKELVQGIKVNVWRPHSHSHVVFCLCLGTGYDQKRGAESAASCYLISEAAPSVVLVCCVGGRRGSSSDLRRR